MTLQEQLRKLTTGGPGVTHIASETLFEDCAKELDFYEHAIKSWKHEEAEWLTERNQFQKAIKDAIDIGEQWIAVAGDTGTLGTRMAINTWKKLVGSQSETEEKP